MSVSTIPVSISKRLPRPGARLQFVSNVLILLWCGFCVFLVAKRMHWLPAALTATPERVQYAAGDDFTTVDFTSRNPARHHLVIFVKSVCRYCTDSMPFYRKTIELASTRFQGIEVVFVTDPTDREWPDYLRKNGINPDAGVAVPFTKWKTRVTPTLVLVDPDRKVKNVWTGSFDGPKEASFLRALEEASPTSRLSN
jgi:hypothetical protein